MSEAVISASIGISIILLANVTVTAIAVDPMYRFDFSILVLKIMLAGVGCAVMLELCRRVTLIFLRRRGCGGSRDRAVVRIRTMLLPSRKELAAIYVVSQFGGLATLRRVPHA